MNLEVRVGSLVLKNPVMTGSGTFGYGEEYSEFMDLSQLGAIVVKGISLEPADGNPSPRIWETPCGMLNAIGLQNIGTEAFIRDKLPFLKQFHTQIIVNFFGDTIEQYVKTADRLSNVEGIDALEMNISCPNKQAGWITFGTDPTQTFKVVNEVRKVTDLPLIVKLSPNVTDITAMAKTAVDAGADALSLINTITGLAVDINTRKPRLANIVGGLSGPAIKPVAVRMVWEVFNKVDVPIVGMGGIMCADDAIEFILAGASAVAIGTANFIDPESSIHVLNGIIDYLKKYNIEDIHELIGRMQC